MLRHSLSIAFISLQLQACRTEEAPQRVTSAEGLNSNAFSLSKAVIPSEFKTTSDSEEGFKSTTLSLSESLSEIGSKAFGRPPSTKTLSLAKSDNGYFEDLAKSHQAEILRKLSGARLSLTDDEEKSEKKSEEKLEENPENIDCEKLQKSVESFAKLFQKLSDKKSMQSISSESASTASSSGSLSKLSDSKAITIKELEPSEQFSRRMQAFIDKKKILEELKKSNAEKSKSSSSSSAFSSMFAAVIISMLPDELTYEFGLNEEAESVAMAGSQKTDFSKMSEFLKEMSAETGAKSNSVSTSQNVMMSSNYALFGDSKNKSARIGYSTAVTGEGKDGGKFVIDSSYILKADFKDAKKLEWNIVAKASAGDKLADTNMSIKIETKDDKDYEIHVLGKTVTPEATKDIDKKLKITKDHSGKCNVNDA